MNQPVNSSTRRSAFASRWTGALLLLSTLGTVSVANAQDEELTNYKSGISVIWQGTKGEDYYEEYFYYDKPIFDQKVVYLKSSTPIAMEHNEDNKAQFHVKDGGWQYIGIDGRDDTPDTGDEGIIRYKLDRDRQYNLKWAPNWQKSNLEALAPAYETPFTLDELEFEDGIPVVGTTGDNGADPDSITDYYYRGILDSVGDEWHVLSFADDDTFLETWNPENYVDQKFWASDAKTILIVVNPKTPCLSPRNTGTGQFYTTPPKAYWTPKIVDQTTYFSTGDDGEVTFEIRDINGNEVFYRINGGDWISNGTNTITLDSSKFEDGESSLDYYYAGNESFVKTRTIVKNPDHPSKAEPHGNYIWGDHDGYLQVFDRVRKRSPYRDYFKLYAGYNDFSNLPIWDEFHGSGKRVWGPSPLKAAFVALVNGYNYKATGAPKSHGRYAIEMVRENVRTLDPVGFEMQMSSDASGNRELHAFGYYDTLPVLNTLFAYDIVVANFRDDQVPDGLTAIDDYFVRDRLASFAYEAMQWSAGMTLLGSPGMWGGARMMGSVSIGIVMSEYSTPYYGTSGFGSVQDTYPLCPYQDDQLTWKKALFDGDAPTSAYPNYTWRTGIDNNGSDSLLTAADELFYDVTYEQGVWRNKLSYFSFGLMGVHLCTWANMTNMWVDDYRNETLEATFLKAAQGTLIGAQDKEPVPSKFHMITLINDRWPEIVELNREWMQSFPDDDQRSAKKAMQDGGILAFAWYDDGIPYGVPASPSNLKVTPPETEE